MFFNLKQTALFLYTFVIPLDSQHTNLSKISKGLGKECRVLIREVKTLKQKEKNAVGRGAKGRGVCLCVWSVFNKLPFLYVKMHVNNKSLQCSSAKPLVTVAHFCPLCGEVKMFLSCLLKSSLTKWFLHVHKCDFFDPSKLSWHTAVFSKKTYFTS